MTRSQILENSEITLKLDRIAWQILEQHTEAKNLTLVGLNVRGKFLAEELIKRLNEREAAINYAVSFVEVNDDNPLTKPVKISETSTIKNANIVIVDDVLNSGRTMTAAINVLLAHDPKSIKVAVLVDRSHKAFPIHANYVGLSLATTLKQHVTFENKKGNLSVWLN